MQFHKLLHHLLVLPRVWLWCRRVANLFVSLLFDLSIQSLVCVINWSEVNTIKLVRMVLCLVLGFWFTAGSGR